MDNKRKARTPRQRLMRNIAAGNCRGRGMASTLMGMQAIGGMDAVALARGEKPDCPFSPDDYMHMMRGVADELIKEGAV